MTANQVNSFPVATEMRGLAGLRFGWWCFVQLPVRQQPLGLLSLVAAIVLVVLSTTSGQQQTPTNVSSQVVRGRPEVRVQTLEEYLANRSYSEGPLPASHKAQPESGSREGEAERDRKPGSSSSHQDKAPEEQQQHQNERNEGPKMQPEAGHNKHHNQHHQETAQVQNSTGAKLDNKPVLQHWQVRSLLNVTNDYPLAYSQIICGYVWPLMALITLCTNLMISFVLTQPDMRTPASVVLTAIAIADIIPILVPVPWFVYLFAMGGEKQVLYPPVVCYFYQHSTRSVSEIFYFLSTWLNLLLAIQDYLAACWPRLAARYCRVRPVVIQILVLTLTAFALNLPQATKLVYKPVKFYYQGQITWGCRALQAKWFKDLVGEYAALYDDIFTAIIVIFVDGGPAIGLIVLTALLIRQLKRQRIQGHMLMEQARTASKRRRERHRQQEVEASAKVMIFVLLAFLAVKIPFATTYSLMIIQSRFEVHFVENLADFQKAISLIDLVFVLSYPLNFTIFCCCSKKFRHKCAELILMIKGGLDAEAGAAHARARRLRDLRRLSSTCSSSRVGATSGRQESLKSALANGRSQSECPQIHMSETRCLLPVKTDAPPPGWSDNNRKSSVAQSETSCHRFEIPPAPVGNLESLIEEGGLCLECILRYERIRSPSATSMLTIDQQQQHQQSPSYPITTPTIVTTRWHAEHSVSQEDPLPGGEEDQPEVVVVKPTEVKEQQTPMSPTRHSQSHLETKATTMSTTTNNTGGSRRSDGPTSGRVLSEPAHGSSIGFYQLSETVSSAEEDEPDTSCQMSLEEDKQSNRKYSQKPETSKLRLTAIGDLRSRSVGGELDKQSESSCKLDTGGTKRHRKRRRLAFIKGSVPEARRSLSLSNSKLSTLPNATGQLADILMTTLFIGEPKKS